MVGVAFAIAGAAVPERARADAGLDQTVLRPRHAAAQPRHRRLRALRLPGDQPHVQRGEPHRRPGRPGRRHLGDGLRRVRRRSRFWQFRNACVLQPDRAACYEARDPLDVALVAAAAMGACFGFLWWNAAPAKIFMGDTGSLALGGLFAGIAIVDPHRAAAGRAGRAVRRRDALGDHPGRRLQDDRGSGCSRWRRSTTTSSWPGWAETTVIVRFWIIAGLAVAFGLGLFYAEFLSLRPAAVMALRTTGLPRRSSPGRAVSGAAAARALLRARRAGDRGRPDAAATERAELAARGRRSTSRRARARRTARRWSSPSPGWRPDAPLLVGRSGGRAGDRARSSWPGGCDAAGAAPWLALTGTNGKTTTVRMLESILRGRRPARGRRRQRRHCRCVEAVLADGYDVLAVELSSFQLHWTPTARARTRPRCSTSRRDHLDWHGWLDGLRRRQGADLGARRRWRSATPTTRSRSPGSPRRRGPRVGFTLGSPAAGELGVVEDLLVDRAFPDVRARRPSWRRSPTSRVARRRTTSPTRWPPPRWPGRTASPAEAVRRRAAPLRARTRTATRCVAERRRGRVRGRQQGHQPARRRGRAGRVPRRSSGSPAGCSRAPTSTGWSPRWPHPAARGGAARHGPAAARATRSRDTPPISPSRWSPARHWGHVRGRRARAARARAPRGHRAARARRRLDGHVPRLRASAATLFAAAVRALGDAARDRHDRAPGRRPAAAVAPHAAAAAPAASATPCCSAAPGCCSSRPRHGAVAPRACGRYATDGSAYSIGRQAGHVHRVGLPR